MKKSRLLLRNNHRCLYNQMMTRILTMRSLRNYMGLERITRLQSLRLKVIPKTPKKNQLRKREASPARKEDHRLQRKRNRNRPKVKGSKKSKNLLLPLRNQQRLYQWKNQNQLKRQKSKSLHQLRNLRASIRIERMRNKGTVSVQRRSDVRENWQLRRKRKPTRKWKNKRKSKRKCLSRCRKNKPLLLKRRRGCSVDSLIY